MTIGFTLRISKGALRPWLSFCHPKYWDAHAHWDCGKCRIARLGPIGIQWVKQMPATG